MYQYEKALFVWGELTNYGITRTTDVTQSVPQHVWSDMVAPDIAKATHSSNAICFYFFQYHFNLFSGMFFEGDEGSRFQDILHTVISLDAAAAAAPHNINRNIANVF